MNEINVVIQGDAVQELKKISDESVDLIYLDPPFYTQKKHSLKNRDNTEYYEFNDVWDSLEDYLGMLRDCLIEIRRKLRQNGSVFFHCDKSASHHIRFLLDQIFGIDNFRSEIIWSYRRWSNAKKGLLNTHQNIFFYSKSKTFKFNKIYTEYSPTTNLDQILQKRVRNEDNKTVYAKDENGEIIINGAKKGVPLSDVWEIPFLNPKAKERTGYPTQKPIILLDQIIQLVTDKGDIVLDPFCGSGTTLVSAKMLGRNYRGIDLSEKAISLSARRLRESIRTESKLLKRGKGYYKQKPENELAILKSIDANPVYRNDSIDGFLKNTFNGKPVPIRIQKKNESIAKACEKMLSSTQSKKSDINIIIRTHKKSDRLVDYVDKKIIVIDSYDLIIKNKVSLDL
jgi:site-specific DNA-methyltransferase (adenine-specific)